MGTLDSLLPQPAPRGTRHQRRSSAGEAADPLRFPAKALPGKADEVEPEAPNHDLVSVLELVPVHPLAVQENPVQAAVVKHTDPA